MKEHVYEKGCFCEELPWSIFESSRLSSICLTGKTICHHCVEIGPDHPMYDKEEGKNYPKQWLAKQTVIAENEGGCNCTEVCLLCILEAAKELGINV